MNEQKFGTILKFFRKQRGYTQARLGELAGVGQVAIANYERGERFPGETQLRNLSEALNVSMDLLLSINLNQNSENPDDPFTVIELFKQIQKDMKTVLIKIYQWKIRFDYNLLDIYEKIIIPLLEMTGKEWSAGNLSVAQEHLISGRIRELIILMAADLPYETDISKKNTWIGLCAPGEEHEFGLLMNSFILREQGWQVINLGTQVPMSDLLTMIQELKPSILCYSITMEKHRNALKVNLEILDQLQKLDFNIIISGAAADLDLCNEFEKVRAVSISLDDAVRQANTISGHSISSPF
ncbi:helix-turn-helix domain-containing protein [Oceanispirochaeta sp.]|uniref:helix-turn-helix domain-containing protein n=1 Tax=Oceanispirochaeta sp. TaxID=2035350 RepID=UPI0026072457|nr:helix-turn-helix domain-containing protein [Oceanispirochaeta sp.]MDA3958791.1 helix-turn-helix domain-containing protein [Oceanispirochaeta sp.]